MRLRVTTPPGDLKPRLIGYYIKGIYYVVHKEPSKTLIKRWKNRIGMLERSTKSIRYNIEDITVRGDRKNPGKEEESLKKLNDLIKSHDDEIDQLKKLIASAGSSGLSLKHAREMFASGIIDDDWSG